VFRAALRVMVVMAYRILIMGAMLIMGMMDMMVVMTMRLVAWTAIDPDLALAAPTDAAHD
jgi:hypothetical protein